MSDKKNTNNQNLADTLRSQGVSRRSFLKFCAATASMMALPPSMIPAIASALEQAKRPSVIWLSFQECTGCTESLTRSHAPDIEELLFDYLSLDYHHTLQAASGEAAEEARLETIRNYSGEYLLIVDGSIPVGNNGVYSTIAGKTNLELLKECTKDAKAVVAVGTCAAFGGIAAARPNPTGATDVASLMESGLIEQKLLVNIPGCPPLPLAISGVLAHFLAFERWPELDSLYRPLGIYGNTVHDRCSRYHFYIQEKFAESFDDEGAKKGWCLYKLGCKGPVTHNACAVYKWNQGTSFPVEAGHPCIGCSEPGFWDRGGFYRNLDDLPLVASSRDKADTTDIEEGYQLYQDNCTYCHSANPSDLKTDAKDIPGLLREGKIRSHNRLEFSDDQLKMIEAFLKSIK